MKKKTTSVTYTPADASGNPLGSAYLRRVDAESAAKAFGVTFIKTSLTTIVEETTEIKTRRTR